MRRLQRTPHAPLSSAWPFAYSQARGTASSLGIVLVSPNSIRFHAHLGCRYRATVSSSKHLAPPSPSTSSGYPHAGVRALVTGLWFGDGGSQFANVGGTKDMLRLHLVNRQSVLDLARVLGQEVDPLRFRCACPPRHLPGNRQRTFARADCGETPRLASARARAGTNAKALVSRDQAGCVGSGERGMRNLPQAYLEVCAEGVHWSCADTLDVVFGLRMMCWRVRVLMARARTAPT